MYNDNIYEKNKLKERIKDIGILALFTVLTAIISTLLMDILIYPIVLFALHKQSIFNTVFKTIMKVLIFVIPAYLVYAKTAELKKNGIDNKEIFFFILKKPLGFIALFLFILLCTAVIISVLYLLLDSNNYLIYKISNSK